MGEGRGEGEKGLGCLGAVGSLFAVGPLWGGTSIAASKGHAEIGRFQGERISAGAVQRPVFASPRTDSESDRGQRDYRVPGTWINGVLYWHEVKVPHLMRVHLIIVRQSLLAAPQPLTLVSP